MARRFSHTNYVARHEIRLLNLDTGKLCRSYETEAGAKSALHQGDQSTRMAAVKVLVTIIDVLAEAGPDEMQPGQRVTRPFVEFDEPDKGTGVVQAEGEFLGYEDGFMLVRYRTADLPRRFQDGSEFRTIKHETEG